MSGTANIVNSTFGFLPGDNSAGQNLVDIRNNTGTLTLNVVGTTFQNVRDSAFGAAGLKVSSLGSAVINLNLADDTFSNMKTVGLEANAKDTSRLTVNVTDGGVAGNGNNFLAATTSSRAIALNAEDQARLDFNINRNDAIKSSGGPVIGVTGRDQAFINGHIDNNGDIANVGTLGGAIEFDLFGTATAAIEASGNTIGNSGNNPAIYAVTIEMPPPGAAVRELGATHCRADRRQSLSRPSTICRW